MSGEPSTTFRWTAIWTTLPELEGLAARLERLLVPPGVILIGGPMGIGKTTLVQALLAKAGVEEPVKSPTFDLVHPHRGDKGRYLHVDLYRLDQPPWPEELDVDETEALVLVEWGEAWSGIFPDRLEVRMGFDGEGRRLGLEGFGVWARRLRAWVRDEEERGGAKG